MDFIESLTNKAYYNWKDISLTGKVIEGEEAIKEAIFNCLFTFKGEILFKPQFSSDLEDILFEIIDEQTAFRIKSLLIQAIEFWEPRIKVNPHETKVIPDPDNNTYYITLSLIVLGIGKTSIEFDLKDIEFK